MSYNLRLIIILFIVHCSSLIAHCSQVDSTKVIYKVILKDGGVFNGSTSNKEIYVITEYARLKIYVWDIDSVDIGILPDFDRQRKIVKMLNRLSNYQIIRLSDKSKEHTYNKIVSLKIGALPIIRNYIDSKITDSSDFKIKGKSDKSDNLTNLSDTLTPENALKHLMIKYKVDRNFVDKDIVYLHQSFKLGGILTVKKKRALIRFDKFTFPREDIKKIIILHKKKKLEAGG